MLNCNQKLCSCPVCSSENFLSDLGAPITKELLEFYAQLGWSPRDHAEFMASSLGSLSQVELVTLLEQEIGGFLDKCHSLFLALVNSIRQGGQDVR
jgi:hypothetical protein